MKARDIDTKKRGRGEPRKGAKKPKPKAEVVAEICQPTHERRNVQRVIEELEGYSIRGVPVPAELAEALPDACAKLLKDATPRVRAAGVKLALACLKHNLELHMHADKLQRLDAGQVTERHAIQLYGKDAPVEAV